MISQLMQFFGGFLSRNGSYILIATIFARILSFLGSWIALIFIPNIELGLVIYALNIISLIIPITGLGASQGLLRFGALCNSAEEKNYLFIYALRKGTIFSLLFIILIIIFSSFISSGLHEAQPYIIYLSLLLFGLFLLETLKTQFRILHKNKGFAFIEIFYNISLVVLVFSGSYLYEELGYVLAMLIAPILTFLIYFPKLKIKIKLTVDFKSPNISFWKYSFFSSLSNVATQLLIVIDIILIGNLMKDPEMITIYKYVSLIPFSLVFIPRVFLTTDFVDITQNLKNKKITNSYIKNYITLFFILSFLIVILTLAFDETILSFFGEEFPQYSNSFIVLIFGIISILLFRGLFGNLLSALGKAYINFWIALFAIGLNIVCNYLLIPKYGIFGAALTSAIMMWVTSILSVILFYVHYRKI